MRFGPLNKVVFWWSCTIAIFLLAFHIGFNHRMTVWVDYLFSNLVHSFTALFSSTMTAFLVINLLVILSPLRRLKLGQENTIPEYSFFSWFAMMFSAGMGIGMLFYGVAEPILHFGSPPPPENHGYREEHAIATTLFHWGLHPWSCYSLVGLSLGYFNTRHGLPLSLRSTFYPFWGKKIYGPRGHAIDVLTVVTTLFGLATSLGLGALQISSGLNFVLNLEETPTQLACIVTLITALATASVLSGMQRGVRILSNVNLSFTVILLAFVFFWGPTSHILTSLTSNTLAYMKEIPVRSLWLSYEGPKSNREWLANWTTFYWAWWISWSPFVGLFLAKISRGRTVGEFLLTASIAPTLFTIFYFTTYGSSAIYLEETQGLQLTSTVSQNIATAIYHFFSSFPFYRWLSFLIIGSLILFFVTSSDSASIVIESLTSDSQKSSRALKVFWSSSEGLIAGVLLLYGGLKVLQRATMISSLPITVVLIVSVSGAIIQMLRDHKNGEHPRDSIRNGR